MEGKKGELALYVMCLTVCEPYTGKPFLALTFNLLIGGIYLGCCYSITE